MTASSIPAQVLSDLWSQANDVLYLHDLTGRFKAVNAAACALYGYSEAELLAMSIQDIVDPAHLGLARTQMQAKASGSVERSPPYEILTRTKEGSPVWVEVSTRIVRDPAGPVLIQGSARNISKRKNAEAITDLVHEASLALMEATSLEAGVEQALGLVATKAGWSYAEAWFPDAEGRYITVGPQWSQGPGFEKFARLAKQLQYEKGEGLAGWLWEHRATAAGPDLPAGGNFPRLGPAKAAGFGAFAAVPVCNGDQFLAGLIFFGARPGAAHGTWVRAAEKVARQLGVVMARRLDVERIRLAGRLFAAQFEALDDALLLLDRNGTPRHANAAFLRLCGAHLTNTDPALPLLDRLEDREGFQLAVAALYEDRRAGLQNVDFDARRWTRSLRPLRSRSGHDLGFLLQLSDPTPI